MALTLGDNFSYQGAKPLDGRLTYNTVAEMKVVADATMYNGCLAYCVEADKTYQWKSKNTVDENTGKWREYSSGGGGGHTIEDSEGTDLTQRDTLQFGEGFKAEDDDTNEKTVISPDVMQSGDMDDVITQLPSIAPKKGGIKYSTTEQVIGEWIDGKPMYQKTIEFGNLPNATSKKISVGVSNIDKIVGFEALAIDNNNAVFILPSSTCTDLRYSIEAVILLPSFEIQIITAVDRSTALGYITIRYTKTTD